MSGEIPRVVDVGDLSFRRGVTCSKPVIPETSEVRIPSENSQKESRRDPKEPRRDPRAWPREDRRVPY